MNLGERVKKAIGVEGSFKETILPMIYYSCTNIFAGGAGYIIGLYFLPFLTEVENIDTNLAGLVVMFATVWDAVTDPAMGIITDRTHSRMGKHRKYLLLGAPVLAVSFIMLWCSFGISAKGNPALTMVYYTLVYMLYKTAYTVIMVPHTAMLPEMAPEYSLRTQYVSVGYLFNSAGMVPSFLFVACIFGFVNMKNFSSDDRGRFLWSGVILALFYAAGVLITFFKTKEKSSEHNEYPPFDRSYVFREYAQVFRNRSFRQYFAISLFYTMSTGFYSNTKYYLIRYVANKSSLYNLLTSVAGVAEASAFPFNYALTMKYGKKRCGTIVTPLMIAGLAIGLFVPKANGSASSLITTVLLFASMLLYPFGFSGIGFVTNNIFPDITDVDELITGRRREGVISTFSTLIKKSVSGVMSAFVGFILKGFGLVTGDAVSEYEKLHEAVYPQSAAGILGVRLCVAAIPLVLTVISLICLRRFNMTKKDHDMIRAAIATKKKYGSVRLTQQQISVCEQISGQKFSDMWIGQNNEETVTDENGEQREPVLVTDEKGDYIIPVLPEENEMKEVTD